MKTELTFIDLFCGLGGFRLAMEMASENITSTCVFSSDIDRTYAKIAELARPRANSDTRGHVSLLKMNGFA